MRWHGKLPFARDRLGESRRICSLAICAVHWPRARSSIQPIPYPSAGDLAPKKLLRSCLRRHTIGDLAPPPMSILRTSLQAAGETQSSLMELLEPEGAMLSIGPGPGQVFNPFPTLYK